MPCPICGGEQDRLIPYPAPKRDVLLRCEQIRLCGACGAGTAIPRPSQETLDRFYASGAYWHAAGGIGQRAHEENQARLRVEHILPGLPSAGALRVADIGAGHGGIARALGRTGRAIASYEFIEPDSAAAASVQSSELPFTVTRRDAPAEVGGEIDLLFLNHVLEHVADPAEFLGSLLAKLAPHGRAYIETPHADFRFKDDVFPHVFFFTSRALEQLGKKLQARTVVIESFGRWLAPKWSLHGLTQRAAARGLALGARLGWQGFCLAMDRVMWRYEPNPDGIWLRWILQKRA